MNMTTAANDSFLRSVENRSSCDTAPYHTRPKSSLLHVAASKARGSSTKLIFAAFVLQGTWRYSLKSNVCWLPILCCSLSLPEYEQSCLSVSLTFIWILYWRDE